MPDWRDQPFTLSCALGARRNAANNIFTPRKLVQRYFTEHQVRDAKDSDGFSSALIDDTALTRGKNLKNQNGKSWPILVYDLDQGQTPDDATRKLREDEIAFISYSSWSHMRTTGAAGPIAKFRIVVFLQEPFVLEAEDDEERSLRHETYKRAYVTVANHYGLVWDQQCKNIARLFYWPTHDGSDEARRAAFIDSRTFETGAPLDFNAFAVAARAKLIAERDAEATKKKESQERAEKHAQRRAKYETVGLDVLIDHCGGAFDVKSFMLDNSPGAHATATGAVESICPNQDAHTDGADDRPTMFTLNPGDPNGKGGTHLAPFVSCNHETCSKTLKTWQYVDLVCVQNDVATDDLLRYVPDSARQVFENNRGLPRGYRRKGGRVLGTTPGQHPVELDLCKDFEVGPLVHDENGRGRGVEITFENDCGQPVTAVVLARALHKDADELRAELADIGLEVTVEPQGKSLFMNLLNKLKPDSSVTLYSRPGWHGDLFATPTGDVIGAFNSASGLSPDVGCATREPGGSYDAYKKEVLGKLTDHRLDHVLLGMLIGCAGPFMELLNLDSLGLYFGGRSKRGKSTAQILQAGVWSLPRQGEGLLFLCKSTANAMELPLERGRDTTTAFDELRQLDERARQSFVFDVVSGTSKNRMTKTLKGQKQRHWRQIITVSGEQALRQILGERGRVTGEAVRMPEVDVATLAEYPDPRYVRQIKLAALSNYGWLGPDVVRAILKLNFQNDPELLRKRFEDRRDVLVRQGSSVHFEAGTVFALIWTVGDTLKETGLLPAETNIERAVRWAYSTFSDGGQTGSLEDAVETARSALIAYLVGNPTKFPFLASPESCVNYQGAEGWQKDGTYYVLEPVFNRIVGEHTTVLSAKQYLAFKGILQKRNRNFTWDWIPGFIKARHVRIVVEKEAFENATKTSAVPAAAAPPQEAPHNVISLEDAMARASTVFDPTH